MNWVNMKFIVAFLIVILCFLGQVSSQERDSLVEIKATDRSGTLSERAGMQMHPDTQTRPNLSRDFTNGFEFQNIAVPNTIFKSFTGWKIETGTSMGIGSIYGFPFGNNPVGLYGRSVWDNYQGFYGMRTYQVNHKLYIGTAGYSDKNFNEYSGKSGIYRQTNFNSSLFVGYKFSEKFSFSAGFTIQRYGDPLNRNQGIPHGGIFP